MRVGIIRFPGSNCDADSLWAFGDALGAETEYVWHKDQDFRRAYDLVVIPGGFSYGDYLRAGAIARFAPIMPALERRAAAGGLVLGICNGFQVLTEAGLLPGVLAANRGLKFISREVHVRIEAAVTPWTSALRPGQVLRLPVAHHDGAFVSRDGDTGQVVLRYVSPEGKDDASFNFAGAEEAVAGLANRAGNVFALMPHPERAMEDVLGSTDGRLLLEGVLRSIERAA